MHCSRFCRAKIYKILSYERNVLKSIGTVYNGYMDNNKRDGDKKLIRENRYIISNF